MTKTPKKLTEKQIEALDLDGDGKAGGSLPKVTLPVTATERVIEATPAIDPAGTFPKPSDDITHDAPAFTPAEAVENRPDYSALEPPTEEDYGPDDAPPRAGGEVVFEDFEPDYDISRNAEVSVTCLFYRNDDDGPYAAIMTQVNAEAKTVHLAAFARTSGFVSAELDVPHRDHREGNGRFWTWDF